jgi:hypothetical protein
MFDLDGNGIVDALDMSWLLGDYSGSDPCDLHRVIASDPVGAEGLAGGGEAGASDGAESAGSTPMTLAAAVAGLGFSSPGEFAAWAANAEPEALAAATEMLVILTQP